MQYAKCRSEAPYSLFQSHAGKLNREARLSFLEACVQTGEGITWGRGCCGGAGFIVIPAKLTAWRQGQAYDAKPLLFAAELGAGNGLWLDKQQRQCLILWKTVPEWAGAIYSWARSLGAPRCEGALLLLRAVCGCAAHVI